MSEAGDPGDVRGPCGEAETPAWLPQRWVVRRLGQEGAVVGEV